MNYKTLKYTIILLTIVGALIAMGTVFFTLLTIREFNRQVNLLETVSVLESENLELKTRDYFKKVIAKSCTVDEIYAEYCQCTAQTLVKKHTMESVVNMGIEILETGDMPDILEDSFDECYHLVKL